MILSELKKELKLKLEGQFNEREIQQLLVILFEKILSLSRVEQSLAANLILTEAQSKELNKAVNQLLENMPVDYIVNETSFYGREFYVDENVLIPRSETEELVLMVLENELKKGQSILDIGSGSGCIPITLELEGSFAKVDACEISEKANEVARKNAKALNASVNFTRLDILTQIPSNTYDIVVSNPPYVKQEELVGLDKNVIEFEPVIALAPDGEPLTFYKRMIEIAPNILKEGGRLYWEIHEDFGKEIVDLLEQSQLFSNVQLKQDLYSRDRLVRAVFKA